MLVDVGREVAILPGGNTCEMERQEYSDLLNVDVSPAHMRFDVFWGRCPRCVCVEGGSARADAFPDHVGAAMSTEDFTLGLQRGEV